MYDFHYNYIKEKYPNRLSKLLFTDTDSLTYSIQTDDLYEDMYRDKHLFDFPDYSNDDPYMNQENEKVIGKMKDEMKGILIREFIGLRAKMYSVLKDRGDKIEVKKAKGVKKYVIKKDIKHQNYKDCLLNRETFVHIIE